MSGAGKPEGGDAEARRGLRARAKALRAGLDPQARARGSEAIAAAVLGHPRWQQARTVAPFVGVRGEPDTKAILAAAWADGKRVLLPRIVSRDEARLRWLEVTRLDQLAPGSFGLLEPLPERAGPTGELAAVDLVLVPGLAFGSDGGRIGLGVGYYDRALAPVRDRLPPLRVGVCFAAFLDLAPVPTGPHDVPMHAVVTERGWVECG